MNRTDLLAFMRSHEHVVEASVSAKGAPQAACIGIVVTDAFELFFDTLGDTRKAQNLRRDPRCSFVIGGPEPGAHCTVQYEGIADEPKGVDLERLQALYFARFPDGPKRLAWPGLTYFRVKPRWIRYSDFGQEPPLILVGDGTMWPAMP